MAKIVVTNHAKKRTKRVLPRRKIALEIAKEAFEDGVRHEETTGNLRKYISGLYFYQKTANNIRIHHQKVFLFNNNVLITILELPQNLNNSVEAIKNKRRLEDYNKRNKRLNQKQE